MKDALGLMEFSPETDRYVEIVDHALTTTRAVCMRLDLERPVCDQVLLDCIDVAEQAPTGGNRAALERQLCGLVGGLPY